VEVGVLTLLLVVVGEHSVRFAKRNACGEFGYLEIQVSWSNSLGECQKSKLAGSLSPRL
jgi:hypothetical protein